jgi:hypothetical protein
MLYIKINVELVVVADEADAVVVELNTALDQMEERHTLSVVESKPSLSNIWAHRGDRH